MKRFILFLFILVQYSIYASPSDTTKNELYAWTLTNCFLIEPFTFDTTISEFQILNQIERFSISNTTLGIIGSPWKSNLFQYQAKDRETDFFFDQNYYVNLFNADNQLYYHAKKPYFEIGWTSAPKKRAENQLNVIYTQNLNKKWNIGLNYRLIASGGQFPRGKSSQHSYNFFTSYIGEKYSMHAAFIRNKIKANENGGVNDSIEDPAFAQALLEDASSVFYKRSIYVSQQYKFGITQKIVVDDTTTISNFKEAGRLNYILRFDNNYRIYSEDSPISGFYDSTYQDMTQTYDSVYFSKIENSLFWSFKEIDKENFKGRLTVGATYDILKWSTIDFVYSQIDLNVLGGTSNFPVFTMVNKEYKNNTFHTIKLFGNLSAKTKNFVFSVDGSLYVKGEHGYKENDKELNLLVSKSINIFKARTSFYAKLDYKQSSPNLYYRKYYSNHFIWENSFSDIITSNFRAGIEIPKIRFNTELYVGNVQNYIYFDTICQPRQLDKLLNVVSLSATKDFKFGIFGSTNKFVYQIPNNRSEITLPDWAIYHSLFLHLKFKKAEDLEFQFGYDLSFTNKFQAYGYMPATGTFHLSNKRNTGDYAIIDVFIKLRIKSALVFVKMEHLNNEFRIDKYYFTANNYSIGTAVLKFGVSWRFMN